MAKKPKKKPKKKPEEFYFGYRELLSEYPNWGLTCKDLKTFRKEKKHPGWETLQMAFLTRIVDLLVEIRNEVKKERTIK